MSPLPPFSAIGPFIRAVPVVLLVILLTPMWLTCVFLSKERRQFALEMVKALGQWVLGDTSALERQGLESSTPERQQDHSREFPE
jgi:hypothetical protein